MKFAAEHPLPDQQAPATGRLAALLKRKIWLPKLVYEGLPYFYALLGFIAIASTLFAPGWYWLVPFAWLLGLMCLHGAIIIWRIRRRYRRRSRAEQMDMKAESPS